MTPSKKLKPFMAYLDQGQHSELTKYSKRTQIAMSQLVREAITMRIASQNPYLEGFNDGVRKCITLVNDNTASKMRFPSGMSFGELLTTELKSALMGGEGEASKG